MNLLPSNGISFKQATVITIVAHIVIGGALYGFLSYRKHLAKIAREQHKQYASGYIPDSRDWNNHSTKLKALAWPKLPPSKPLPVPSQQQIVNSAVKIIKSAEELASTASSTISGIISSTKDTVTKIEKQLEPPKKIATRTLPPPKIITQPRPVQRIKPTPTPRLVYTHAETVCIKNNTEQTEYKEEYVERKGIPMRAVKLAPPP